MSKDDKKKKKKAAPVVTKRTKTTVTIDDSSRERFDKILKAFGKIKSKQRGKIIKFLVNMILTGGNQTQSALEAGFGNMRGTAENDEKKRFQNAAAEATRLLKIPQVKEAYGLLQEDSYIDDVLRLMVRKDNLIKLLFDHALFHFYSDKNTFKSDIELIARLSGYFDNEDPRLANKELKGINVRVPTVPQRNANELRRLQELGLLEEIIDGEIIEES